MVSPCHQRLENNLSETFKSLKEFISTYVFKAEKKEIVEKWNKVHGAMT